MSVLVYIEIQGGVVTPTSLELLSGARALTCQDVIAAVIANEPGDTSVLAAADRILTVTTADATPYRPDIHIDLLSQVIEQIAPELVLIPNSYIGIDLTAAVAHRTGRPVVTFCTGLRRSHQGIEASCLAYGGKLSATISLPLPAVVGVNAGALGAAAEAGRASHESLALPAPHSRIRFVSATALEAEAVDIRQVERLVCVGRGIGEKENIGLAQDLAEAIGAEIVGSRPIIDSGWLAKSRQVGKSGLKVKPKLYIALGISGAPEHLEGMSDAGLIVAVNSDPTAPIFDVAHIGLTCEIDDLLPLLTKKLLAEEATG
jgi:electron transfer flavoprotein alpha subunit